MFFIHMISVVIQSSLGENQQSSFIKIVTWQDYFSNQIVIRHQQSSRYKSIRSEVVVYYIIKQSHSFVVRKIMIRLNIVYEYFVIVYINYISSITIIVTILCNHLSTEFSYKPPCKDQEGPQKGQQICGWVWMLCTLGLSSGQFSASWLWSYN